MQELKAPARTLYRWREEDKWDEEIPANTVEEQISRRICYLTEKPDKTELELKELFGLIDKLGELALKLATARQLDRQPAPDQQEEAKERRGKAAKEGWEGRRKKKGPKNDISGISKEQLDQARELLFKGVKPTEAQQYLINGTQPDPPIEGREVWGYLATWYEHRKLRNRFILKSRQIGATYYFSWEALEDAILTGDNQIFISASRDQAEVFKAYIITFAKLLLGIELSGDPIILSNFAELRFLSTNSRTAQSYHGHLYLDEVFWIPKYKQLWKLASAMSSQKKWRRTLFSTPSALSHEAYERWGGEEYNKGRPEKDKKEFDVSHDNLKHGWMGPDKFWRHMVNIEDAAAQGCDLFDIDELKEEYSKDDFDNLFMCKFIDDAKSIFPLWLLMKCCEGVSKDDWDDYDEKKDRPFGNKPVSIGYDPSRKASGDKASKAKLAVPASNKEKWRVLKREDWKGHNFNFQASRIKDDTKSHNVVFIGIDSTGLGVGVYDLVLDFFPEATPIFYSPQVKTSLVMKGLEVMNSGRFQYDAYDKELTRAFLMIRPSTTPGTGQITYISGRTEEDGHAEAAWSVLNALQYEPIGGESETTEVW